MNIVVLTGAASPRVSYNKLQNVHFTPGKTSRMKFDDDDDDDVELKIPPNVSKNVRKSVPEPTAAELSGFLKIKLHLMVSKPAVLPIIPEYANEYSKALTLSFSGSNFCALCNQVILVKVKSSG